MPFLGIEFNFEIAVNPIWVRLEVERRALIDFLLAVLPVFHPSWTVRGVAMDIIIVMREALIFRVHRAHVEFNKINIKYWRPISKQSGSMCLDAV